MHKKLFNKLSLPTKQPLMNFSAPLFLKLRHVVFTLCCQAFLFLTGFASGSFAYDFPEPPDIPIGTCIKPSNNDAHGFRTIGLPHVGGVVCDGETPYGREDMQWVWYYGIGYVWIYDGLREVINYTPGENGCDRNQSPYHVYWQVYATVDESCLGVSDWPPPECPDPLNSSCLALPGTQEGYPIENCPSDQGFIGE